MEEMNAVILEDKRNRTPAERFRLLQAFLDGHGRIGLALRKPEEHEHFMPYSEVQRRILERKSSR